MYGGGTGVTSNFGDHLASLSRPSGPGKQVETLDLGLGPRAKAKHSGGEWFAGLCLTRFGPGPAAGPQIQLLPGAG